MLKSPLAVAVAASLLIGSIVVADQRHDEPMQAVVPPIVQPLRGIPLSQPLPEGVAGPILPAARLHVDAAAWETMNRFDSAMLNEVPLSDGATVNLRVSRINPFATSARIVVVEDGPHGTQVERELPQPEISAWSGTVAGFPGSSAFICRSAAGLSGWIRFADRMEIISSGDVTKGDQPMISNAAALPASTFVCGGGIPSPIEDALELELDAPPPMVAAACRQLPLAFDTDQEMLAKFGGNTTTGSAYVATMIAALSDIYSRDFNVRPSITYLRWWASTDPWTQTGTCGGTGADQLSELRTYWNTNMRTTPRALTALLSGRGLGGGCAWLSSTCSSVSSGTGYSVSADLGGYFPYPVVSHSSGNWDLIVVAHEIGHNMGAHHTHDIGVDGCGSGDCTLRLEGTIMSYCHTCTGGVSNINMNFDSVNIPTVISHVGSKSCTNPTVALPAALGDSYSMLEGSTNVLDVLANDLAGNCESISLQGLASTSTLGVPLSILPTGSPTGGQAIAYDPPRGTSGIDSFTYFVRDASNQNSAVVTVSIDIQPSLLPYSGIAGNEPQLFVRYYNITGTPNTLPDFSGSTPYQYGLVPLLVFGSSSGVCAGSGRSDSFGAVFEGWVDAPTLGTYTFSLSSDAGSQLYIDGVKVVDHNGLHAYSEKTGTVYMAPGMHSVRIPFFEVVGTCGLTLKWALPGTTSRVVVPSTSLTHGGQVFDLDGSSTVDAGDMAILLLSFGSECTENPCYGEPNGVQRIGIDSTCMCPEDLDGSGSIDFGDVAYLLLY